MELPVYKNLSPAMAQFVRYLVTGVVNVLVTLAVIFVCKSLIGMNPWISNAAGYVAGVINSYIWNRKFVFRSHSSWRGEALRFVIGFGVCYAVQFAVTWSLMTFTSLGEMLWHTRWMTFSGYTVATLSGMACYIVCNYCYNRIFAFRA